MHADQRNEHVDLFLHIGMAYGWHFVSVERAAYKQTMTSTFWSSGSAPGVGSARHSTYYRIKDNAGHTVEHAGECPWGDDVPIGLSPDINVDAVAESAQALLTARASLQQRPWQPGSETPSNGPEVPVRPHTEAGTYCCGFIYYESMAARYAAGKKGNVLFCHVPGELDSKSLDRARDAILAVIVSAASHMVQ